MPDRTFAIGTSLLAGVAMLAMAGCGPTRQSATTTGNPEIVLLERAPILPREEVSRFARNFANTCLSTAPGFSSVRLRLSKASYGTFGDVYFTGTRAWYRVREGVECFIGFRSTDSQAMLEELSMMMRELDRPVSSTDSSAAYRFIADDGSMVRVVALMGPGDTARFGAIVER